MPIYAEQIQITKYYSAEYYNGKLINVHINKNIADIALQYVTNRAFNGDVCYIVE